MSDGSRPSRAVLGGLARTSPRRAFLRRAGAAVLAVGSLPALTSACDSDGGNASDTSGPSPEAAASTDGELVDRALRDGTALLATYDAVLRRHDGLRALLAGPRDELQQHIEVLSGAADDSAAPRRQRSPVPRSRRKALRELAASERTAIRRRRRDAAAAESGELARLLASIAACHAQHVQVVAPGSGWASPAAEPSESTAGVESVVEALNETLAGEHAALYAYGVIGGRLDADSRPVRDATEAWETHQRRRATLTQLVEAGGGAPVGAETGYQLPNDVRGISDARAVAQLVEDRCAVLYATLAATATGEVRKLAVDALIDAATRAVRWGAPTSPLPGVGVATS